MEISIYLNNGMHYNVMIPTYNAEELSNTINQPGVNVITIGDIVLSKHVIIATVPTESVKDPNLSIYLGNQMSFTTYDSEYNAANFAKLLNNQALTMVPLGDAMLNRNSVMMVAPIVNAPDTEEQV